MYKSQALLILSIPLALLSIFSFLYGVVFQTSKLSTKAERSEFENAHQPYFQPQTDKVIFIVIDALRFDFFLNQGQDPDLPENWKDHQFRKFMKKIWETPENSVLLKAHVDAPTLTTARVPSMMTGNFPRKASNFHHNTIFPISEDNILYQMKKAGRKMYYGGDPIWPVYFPDTFVDSVSERDYDIKMTDVDDEVYDFVYDVFKNKTYDLLIGHFLGLDHMGHGGGFSHPSTIHAKNKIEQFLLKIMEEMDDQITLLVLGDHGAELNGEHGKDSPGESYVPIAGYNKKGFFKNSHHSSFAKAMKYLRNDDVVKQVDLTPTLAMLMGVPVPFSNAGQVLNDFYPAREFPANQACQNRTFELQLLYNNYANSEQIMKYLEEKQTKQAKIFDEKYFKELQDEFKKLNANFKKLLNKVHDTEACEKIHEPILNTVAEAQKFSNKAYDLIKNTNPYDFSMALAGVAGLTLLLVSYILLSQILQVEGYRRQTHFKLNSFLTKRALTRFSFFIILAAISFTLTKKFSSTITICSFILHLIFCGSLLISFVKLQKSQTKVRNNTPPSYSKEIEGFQAVDNSPYSDKGSTPTGAFNKNSEPETPHTPMNDDEAFKIMPENKFAAFVERIKGLKEKFSSPQIYTYSAVAIFAGTLYLTFTNDLAEVRRAYFIKHTPILSFMVIGFLIAFNVKRFFRHIIALNFVICSIVYFGPFSIYSWRRSVPLGIFIISEWYFKEIYFMFKKLKTTKIMALLQFSSVCTLFAYLLDKENPEVLYKLTLPRVIWGLMLASIVAGKIQKISAHATKRNFQFCFVILLLMLRLKKQILTFAVLLQLMNLTNKVFQRVNIKNTLYPTVLAFLGYMGLYFIYMTEQYVPFTYVPASLGKSEYDYIISPLFFMIYLLCTFILASLFMSYYNQQIELDAQAQDTALPQIKSENQDSTDEKTAIVVKRRNVFPFIIFYSVLIVSVSIETLYLCVKNEPFTFERFLLNSGFYLYVLVSGIFLIK